MRNTISLRLERDCLDRPIRRILITKETSYSHKYSYNNHGDLSKETREENGQAVFECSCEYEYDEYGNKTTRIRHCWHKRDEEIENFEYVYRYKNEYADNKLVKKTAYYDADELYENLYFYDNSGRLIRAERYNKAGGTNALQLWRTDFSQYYGDVVEKSTYLSGGILSHYTAMKLNDDKIENKRLLSPSKGKYYWCISSFDESSCSIYVSEEYLTAEILLEILSYIDSVRKPNSEIMVIIECSDTLVNNSNDKYRKIEEEFKRKAIEVVYSP